LPALLRHDVTLGVAEPGIHTVLAPEERGHHYDDIARLYDVVVGNRFYNRLVWGNWPRRYRRFAREALLNSEGLFLDAGCGSLVFTADVYAAFPERPMILMDRSLGMLRRARRRLARRTHGALENVVFLQADIHDLPLRDDTAGAAAAWGMLHLFDTPASVVGELMRVAPQAWCNALATGRTVGDQALAALHRNGEAAEPRSADELSERLAPVVSRVVAHSRGNMAYLHVIR
jgi:ubiquinone/menaquinone biosynthesis C-methylase UbiE